MKQTSSNRIGWIDSAKGISIFLIVLGHCADKSGADNILLHLCMFTGVGVFFLLAGMTFCDRNGGTKTFPWFDDRPFSTFVRDLWQRIFFPYLFWSVVSILIYAAAGSTAARVLHSDRHNFGIGKNLLGMLWANSGTGYMEWNRPLWFLPCLAAVELIWFLILKGITHLRNRRVGMALYGMVMAASVVWLLGTAACGLRLRLPWELETAFSVLGYFGAGRLVRHGICESTLEKGRRMRKEGAGGTILQALLSFALLAAEFMLISGTKYADFRADRFSDPELLIPDMAVGTAAVLLASHVLENSKAVHYLGTRTMAILVMHKFPIMALKVLFRRIGFQGSNAGESSYEAVLLTILLDLCMAVVTVLLCLAAERLISTFAPALFGRKKRRE